MQSRHGWIIIAGALGTSACATTHEGANRGSYDQRSHVVASCAEQGGLQTAEAASTIAETASTYSGLEEQGFTGAIVVLNGTVVAFCRATGLAGSNVDYAAGIPGDVGSISKPATALAILALVERGKVDLDDSISKWFDDAPSDKANITVRQLLLHMSGLPEYIVDTDDYTILSQGEAIGAIFSKPLESDPGSQWSYSNPGYTLLAAVVERASEQPYFQAMNDLVFAPAGVQASYDPAVFEQVANISSGGKWTDLRRDAAATAGPFWSLWGAGGLYMSAADLAVFMKAFMEGKIVSPEMVASAREPLVLLNDTNAGGLAYGLVKRGDRWIYYFNGMGQSGSADLWGDPDTNRVVAVTANSAKPHAISAGRKVAGVAIKPF